MLALEIIVAAAVLVGVAFLASRDGGAGLEDEPTDHADLGIPDGRPLRSADIAGLRLRAVSGFRGGLRGYRYDDVDAVMAKVEESLRTWEADAKAAKAPTAPVLSPRRRRSTGAGREDE